MKVEFQSISDQGSIRPNNEDAIKSGIVNDGELIWMVIADGMGGHLAGEVASKILVEEIEQSILNLSDIQNKDWLCFIEIALNRANNKVFAKAENDIAKKGMGTTAVVLILIENQCYIGWVGDSRCYLYQPEQDENNQLVQLTKDHSMVQALVDKGAISEREAKVAVNKNMLTKAIGIKRGVKVDTIRATVYPENVLFLSTDGLHDSINNQELLVSIKKIAAGIDMKKTLVELAIQSGSKDNITFGSILIQSL